MTKPETNDERCDAWYDGSAICIIAVGSHGDPLDLAEHEADELIDKLQRSVLSARGDTTESSSLSANKLDNESKQIQSLIVGKSLTRVLRPRSNEVVLEFSDGTRFFVDAKSSLGFSVT